MTGGDEGELGTGATGGIAAGAGELGMGATGAIASGAGELGIGVAGVAAPGGDRVELGDRSRPRKAVTGSKPARLKATIKVNTAALNRTALNNQRTTLLTKPPLKAPRSAWFSTSLASVSA